jgi:hypothetical protein
MIKIPRWLYEAKAQRGQVIASVMQKMPGALVSIQSAYWVLEVTMQIFHSPPKIAN